jgi:hypothetical protein
MNKTDRAMLQLCKDVIVLDSEEDEAPSLSDMARRAQQIAAALAPKGRRTMPRHPEVGAAKARKATKKEGARERRRRVYAEVDARSCGYCESCWIQFGKRAAGTSRDHFWGRAREESTESVWKLCADCDHDKTNNRPARIWWLALFLRHARAHEYDAQAAKAAAAIEYERAQHPTKEAV